jgi:hypothetical protein
MEPAQAALLQGLIRSESRSLLQYVSESFPWSKSQEHAACDAVCTMAQAEAAAVSKLARWLAKQRVPVTFPGAYPMQFTTANFVSLHFLLPRLAEDQRKRLTEAETIAEALSESEAKALVQALIDLKTSHLQQLRALQAQTGPPALAS